MPQPPCCPWAPDGTNPLLSHAHSPVSVHTHPHTHPKRAPRQVALNSLTVLGVPVERDGPPPLPSKAALKAARAKALVHADQAGVLRSRAEYALVDVVRTALEGKLAQEEFPYLVAPPSDVPDASTVAESARGT
jgi:hypothetical protein